MLFYKRLKAQGWDRATIEPIFIAAHQKISTQSKQKHIDAKEKDPPLDDQLIIHLEYHPDDIPRKEVREIYNKHCGELFEKILGVKKTTAAYSRPENLRDILQSAKLYEKEGKEASTFYRG